MELAPTNRVVFLKYQPSLVLVELINGDTAVFWSLSRRPPESLLVVPMFEDKTKRSKSTPMELDPDFLPGSIAEQSIEKYVNPLGHIRETLTARRSRKKPTKRVPVISKPGEIRFRLFRSHVVGVARIAFADELVHPNHYP